MMGKELEKVENIQKERLKETVLRE